MKLTNWFRTYSLKTVLAIPLALGMFAPPAHAQTKAAPQAIALLDICHNEVTGKWRYSGVVSVLTGAKPGQLAVNVDSWLQNKTSDAGYFNAFKADSLVDLALAASPSTTTVAKFDTEGAPLSLGSVRNNASVRIVDLANPASPTQNLQASGEFQAAVCGCQQVKGCTRTQGYWGSKPGVVWPAPYSRSAPFFASGLTWQQIMDTPPRGGNAYIILAHQYIAAVLNRAAGASAPTAIQTVINNATTFFSSGTNLDSCSASQCETQKNWAGILDTYNNGLYPNAPKHCPD
ncbi:MAG: hypothetical protein V4723_09080 [Pseudomonadota bacterium]